MIKNLLFDLAGVLFNLDIETDTKALHAVGLPDFDVCLKRPEIFRPVLAYLNGLLPEDEFLTQIRPCCNADATDEAILYSMNAVLGDLPVSRMAMLVELRKRYHVYLLSNLNERDWLHTQRVVAQAGYSIDQLFDQAFVSYQLHLAKPDPRIYEHVIAQTGLLPEETIYLDDMRENVESGLRMGFVAHLVPMNHLEDVLPTILM